MKGIEMYFCALVSLCVTSVFSSPRSQTTLQTLPPLKPVVTSCYYNGKTYPIGNFQENPCSPCTCTSSGQAYCAIVDCFFTQCVDPVHDKTKCCPTCPNGPNCRAPDGTIIKHGDTYHPDPSTTCHCQTWSSAASCEIQPPVLTPLNLTPIAS